MNNLLKEYRDKADNLFEKVGKFACYTRGIEFQEQSINDLENFKLEVIKQKDKAISSGDNDLSNAFESFSLVIQAMICEFKMWINLKNENFNDAWDFLVDAQNNAVWSMQAHEINGHLTRYISRLNLLEKVLFPPQLFFSDRSVISKSECSICGKSMDECEHLKGKFYMGKQCVEIVRKIEKIHGYDIVKDPANKKCRAQNFTKDNKIIDIMTFREIKNNFG